MKYDRLHQHLFKAVAHSIPQEEFKTRRRRLRIYAWIVMCSISLGTAVTATAQSTFGSIRGVVQDESGGVLPDAVIIVHSVDENTNRTVTADSEGNFVAENMKAGSYTVGAHHDGFADTVVNGVKLEARQDVRLTVVLKPATQATIVDVTAG